MDIQHTPVAMQPASPVGQSELTIALRLKAILSPKSMSFFAVWKSSLPDQERSKHDRIPSLVGNGRSHLVRERALQPAVRGNGGDDIVVRRAVRNVRVK